MNFGQLIPKPYRGLPRSVYIVFLDNVVNSLGNFVWPFLTLFLSDKLGMNKVATGFFVMLATMANVPGLLLGGKLADHFGRKRVYLVARGLAAAFLVPCAFVEFAALVPWLLIASCMAAGGAMPPIRALVADVTTPENRQPAFALLYLGHNLGFAVGPALAGLLYRHHLPWLFLGDAGTTFVAMLLTALYVAESLPGQVRAATGTAADRAAERPETGGLLPVLWRRPRLLAFAFILLVYNLAYVQMGFALPIQMRELFGAEGPKLYGLIMSFNGLVVVGFTTLVTRATRRLSHTASIGLGGLAYAVGFGMVGLIRGSAWFYAAALLWTLGEIVIATNWSAYIADNTPMSHRGRFNGALDAISDAGLAFGPLAAGVIIQRGGVRAIWPLSFLLVGAAALCMFALGRARHSENQAGHEVVGGV